MSHANGLFSTCQIWNDRLDLAVAPDALSLTRRPGSPAVRSLVQVIVDGSAAMDPHWARDPGLNSSRVAAAVFQIASRLNPEREDLIVGFLSCGHFEAVNSYDKTPAIEATLNRVRERERLRQRGSFVRPMREASRQTYAAQPKRIVLLSESDVPDWEDVEDFQVESCERFRLKAAGLAEEPAVFTADGRSNKDLLDRFRHPVVTIPELRVSVGPELPLEIEPSDGAVSRCDDGYCIQWPNDPTALHWQIRLRLSGPAPHQVRVSCALKQDGEKRALSFPTLATSMRLEPIGQVTHGVLGKTEAACWQILCDPGTACSECGKRNVHFFHDDYRRLLKPQPVFPLPVHEGGWLLLRSSDPEWTAFQTGCRFDGLSIAVVNGSLQWSAGGLHLEPVLRGCEDRLYRLEHGDQTLYIIDLNGYGG
jgi:hypothetical protein